MNKLIQKSATPFGVIVVAALFAIMVMVLLLTGVTRADDGAAAIDGCLLTIHDRGTEKVVVSKAATVADALTEAGITLDKNDAVEPAKDEKLVASEYQVNIYRARPVIIVEGSIRQKVVTPYQTAKQIAESVGITLYDEDIAEMSRVDDLSGAGLQLTITRAKAFSFDQYGKILTVRTQGKTVADMLSEKGIKLGESDKVSPSLDTLITDGMGVRVWREGKQTITVDEDIDFDVEEIADANQSIGYREIKTAGVKGKRTVSYEVTVENGVEVARTEIASITIEQPKSQIEIVGVKGKYNTPSENETVAWDFFISQGFSRTQTAGILGNLMQEHGFRTTDTAGGLGIAQWTGSRRLNLINKYPDSYDNIYSQLEFLMYELNGSYAAVKNMILADTSVDPAGVVEIFQNNFERCNPYYCMLDQRVDYARNILASH